MPHDLSGRLIPETLNNRSSIERVVAVPPVRNAPNEFAQEFFWFGYASLAAAGAAFVTLTDPQSAANFAQLLAPQTRARIDTILVYCPDMIAAVAPYLFARVTINNQPAPAWGFIPIWPRAGVASLSFPAVMDLQPNAVVGLFGENTDAVNTHFLGVYLHGWQWPKDLVEGG